MDLLKLKYKFLLFARGLFASDLENQFGINYHETLATISYAFELAGSRGENKVVAICGKSCSGKSLLASLLTFVNVGVKHLNLKTNPESVKYLDKCADNWTNTTLLIIDEYQMYKQHDDLILERAKAGMRIILMCQYPSFLIDNFKNVPVFTMKESSLIPVLVQNVNNVGFPTADAG
ncbi:MAG: hypothetical protein QM504_06790 [Pseudomonadota bacterium]